ncbi:binder of USO1 and GRH1 protein 1 isoform X14 [Quillaja saponaria]|uniref:Binder of USO1 and GRH1 protein 1 isoform X14 n=1 Tax=Quillaja saponaria TaxID=32244 RepID=A0AAD7LMV3_QUISA|nr:binder of USO1 and GRH1 protein 1 isoform X14 [Quillaja saponaria]
MEEEKKKRRNKKKKNKQIKTGEVAGIGIGETASWRQDQVSNGKDEYSQLSETVDMPSTNIDSNGHRPNDTESAMSEDTIKKLKEENDMHIQRKATLEEIINQLRVENELQIQKQAGLEMKIVQLLNEKDSLLQKEARLEEKVNQLVNENDVLSSKGDSTKETISNLHGNISRLQVQVVELEEARDSLLQENRQLVENVSVLQSTIQNLEKSSSSSCSPDPFMKDHYSENEDLKSQIEAASALVEKLITENAELVEKVNELYVELDGRSATAGISVAAKPNPLVEFSKTADVVHPTSEFMGNVSITGKKLDGLEVVPVKVAGDSVDVENAAGVVLNSSPVFNDSGEIVQIPLDDSVEVVPVKDADDSVDVENAARVALNSSPVSNDSGEIVQIPLDENEVLDKLEQADKNAEKDAVPLSDAPLIGAPFRMISFVAKFVSGADLVNKSTSISGH